MAASWPPVPILPPPPPSAAYSAHLLINALPLPPSRVPSGASPELRLPMLVKPFKCTVPSRVHGH